VYSRFPVLIISSGNKRRRVKDDVKKIPERRGTEEAGNEQREGRIEPGKKKKQVRMSVIDGLWVLLDTHWPNVKGQ